MSQIDRTMVEAVNILNEKDNDIKEELLDLIDSVNELGTGVYVNEDAEAGQVPVADGDGGYTWSDIESGVASVNGKTGTVVLDAEDVGAIPDTETIPTKTSDLINDSGFITSAPVSSVNTKTGAVVLAAGDIGVTPPTGQSFTTVQGAVDSHDQSIGNLTNVVDELDVDVALLSADKQDKSDNSLSTTAKTVVGAINELAQDKVDYSDFAQRTVTIAVADWSGGTTCTKTVTGVTATNSVIVDPSDASVEATAQTTDSLTFTASATPTSVVTVKVVILP